MKWRSCSFNDFGAGKWLPVKLGLTANLTFSIRSLTLETDLEPSFVVPAGETYILKLKRQ